MHSYASSTLNCCFLMWKNPYDIANMLIIPLNFHVLLLWKIPQCALYYTLILAVFSGKIFKEVTSDLKAEFLKFYFYHQKKNHKILALEGTLHFLLFKLPRK